MAEQVKTWLCEFNERDGRGAIEVNLTESDVDDWLKQFPRDTLTLIEGA